MLRIDVFMLSKIVHGERQVQWHMLKPIAELFGVDYKCLHIQFLKQRLEEEFGDAPFFMDTLSLFK